MLSLLFTGSAMATTAIGTLIPILRDAGELRTRFGTYLLAAGGVGEFGPILLITLVFSTKSRGTRRRSCWPSSPWPCCRLWPGALGGRGWGCSSARWRRAASSRSGSRW